MDLSLNQRGKWNDGVMDSAGFVVAAALHSCEKLLPNRSKRCLDREKQTFLGGHEILCLGWVSPNNGGGGQVPLGPGHSPPEPSAAGSAPRGSAAAAASPRRRRTLSTRGASIVRGSCVQTNGSTEHRCPRTTFGAPRWYTSETKTMNTGCTLHCHHHHHWDDRAV